jgi:hypothetical protein
MATAQPSRLIWVKTIYFYLVSFVTLMMMIVSSSMLIETALKTFIFTKADSYTNYYPAAECGIKPDGKTPLTAEECLTQQDRMKKNDEENRINQRQRDLVNNLSMLIVSAPLFFIHWRMARKKE